METTISGYRRTDGNIGVRNFVAIIPISVAVSRIASELAEGDWNVRATPHQMGTAQSPPSREQTERVLTGIGCNPNVGAAVVIELGTEDIEADTVADGIARTGKPVETLSVREEGGTQPAIDAGENIVDQFTSEIEDACRESADVGELTFGVECGGSDATSGLAANPAVGHACDLLVDANGTVSFSETPEFIGAEHILAERCVSEEVREELLDRVERREKMAEIMGVDLRGAQPTPGNQEGGLTTIEEKSLGAISKGGTSPVQDIVDYGAQLPNHGGLVLMDTPGYDVESVVGKVAGGAQIIAFTTGRGSTTGNPIAPVIKVTGNPNTWNSMYNNMDVNASTIIEGDSIQNVGERIFDLLVETANGQQTESEKRQLEEFAINEIQPKESKIR